MVRLVIIRIKLTIVFILISLTGFSQLLNHDFGFYGSLGGEVGIHSNSNAQFDSITEYSLTLNGTNQYIQIVDLDLLSPADTGTYDEPFYISFWAKLDSQNTGFVSKAGEYVSYLMASNNYLLFDVYSENNATIGRRTSTIAAYYHNWHNFVLAYKGGKNVASIDIYIDKVAKDVVDRGSGTFTYMSNKTASHYIGFYSTYYMKGDLNDYRFCKGTINAAKLDSLYNHNLTGEEVVMLPATNGYSNNVHNVIPQTNQVLTHGNIANFNQTTNWVNTNTFFQYENEYGYTKINDYIFPSLTTKESLLDTVGGYILWGQSNADGYNNDSTTKETADSVLLEQMQNIGAWNNLTSFNAFLNSFVQGEDTTINLAPSLLYNYDTAGQQSFIIKYGIGGTYLRAVAGDDWNVSSSGELYSDIKGYINNGMTAMFKRGGMPYIKSIISVHGENDMQQETALNQYLANYTNFIDSINGILGGKTNVQTVMISDSVNYTPATIEVMQGIQKTFIETYEDGDTINTDTLNFIETVNCCWHYTDSSQIYLGNKIYQNTYMIQPNTYYMNKLFPSGWSIKYNLR
jgi:hypothetical protein